MKPMRRLNRRSFLGRVVGAAALGGPALLVLPGRAEALQVTDNDRGPNADPVGRGRGLTDGDIGASSDPPGGGRRGCTDRDAGENSDPAGRGRGNGITDRDVAPNADPARCGRRR